MSINVFDMNYLDDLVQQATQSPRLRQHRNVHADFADPCQRLFNAMQPGTYLRPHRHGTAQGAETMIGVRGLLALVVFDDSGVITQVQKFGAGSYANNPTVAVGVETPPGIWHTVVSLEPGSVLIEMKAGPFNPNAPKYPAPWAPDEGTPEGKDYLLSLVELVQHRLAGAQG